MRGAEAPACQPCVWQMGVAAVRVSSKEWHLSTQEPQYFDLNIGEILKASWEPRHAVREIIANALDEQALTGTSDVVISETPAGWLVRDQDRGLRYEHLRQNEDVEKLTNPSKVIGKFGLGLKDALATLHRRGIEVKILSAHGDITVTERPKRGFEDLPTLHAVICAPSDPERVGTDVVLRGLDAAEMGAAKEFFLRFSGEEVLGRTPYGEILRRVAGGVGRIYVKGLLVAEEPAFACSYNVMSLTAAMDKALNRERANVGRTAYSDRVKSMLLACDSPAVFEILALEIGKLDKGTAHEEVKWADVAVHAVKILSQKNNKVVFVSSAELEGSRAMVDQARGDGYSLVKLPESIRAKLSGLRDDTGAPVRSLDVFTKEWVESFKFDFVDESRLTSAELILFKERDKIAALAGGWPEGVRDVLVSTTMRPAEDGRSDAVGIWETEASRIIIKRDQLASLKTFAGALLHEITHACTGKPDVSREFELALTQLIGHLVSKVLSAASASPKEAEALPVRAARSSRSTQVSSRRRLASADSPVRAKTASGTGRHSQGTKKARGRR